jgi:hypothetical protein
MATKYTKGVRCYHLIEDDSDHTKCGWNHAAVQAVVETTKEKSAWPNCPKCVIGLPDEMLVKLKLMT